MGHFLPSFQLDAKKQQTDKFIALFTLIYVAIGFVVFILIPAGIFAAVDYWSYLDSVYFAVISQTTVGFGDLVTGKVDDVAIGLFIDLETAVLVVLYTGLCRLVIWEKVLAGPI